MARKQQTEIAILGALTFEPMTAYAVREAIRDVLGHFWSESFGQIYPTLDTLTSQGLVSRTEGERRGSSLLTITAAGETRLRELLAEPIAATPPRNGLLLRLFFGRVLGAAACRSLLEEARTDAQHQLARFEQITAAVRTEDASSPDLTYQLITISAGRHSAQSTLAWVAEALELLEATEKP